MSDLKDLYTPDPREPWIIHCIDGGMEDADQQEPPRQCPHCGRF